MVVYPWVKALHVLAAFTLVGPLVLTPRWLSLTRHEAGRAALHDLHLLTGASGWLVLISGGVMLFLQHGGMLFVPWMQLSIALFVGIQLFDHFWADRREEALEHDTEAPTSSLKIWLMVKLGLYVFITLLMMFKPLL